MTTRWYLLPIIGTGTHADPRKPKYQASILPGVTWGMMDYGLMPVCIFVADVTAQQHSDMIANADVRAIPANLDSTVGGGAVSTTRNFLEALSIPGNWVGASDTWRSILRGTAGLFQFAQRVYGEFGVMLIDETRTLDTTWNQLPQAAKDILLSTATELGIDTSQATGNTTLRQIYKAFGDAWGDKTFLFGSFTL